MEKDENSMEIANFKLDSMLHYHNILMLSHQNWVPYYLVEYLWN